MSGLLYFSRVRPLPDFAQTAQAACNELKEYAKLVVQHFGPKMCKFNLHVFICRLLYQEIACGKAAFGNEYLPVENLIQWAKSIVRGRTTKYPELVLVHGMLIDEALSGQRRQHPAEMVTAEEWLEVHDNSTQQAAGVVANLDTPVADGPKLMGVGTSSPLLLFCRLSRVGGMHAWNRAWWLMGGSQETLQSPPFSCTSLP